MEKQNSYSHIIKYTGLLGSVQGLGIVVGLVRNKLVALLLGPAGMGLLALFASTIKLVGDSTNLGLATSAIREIASAYDSGDRERLSRQICIFRHWCVLTSLVGFLVCAALAPLLSRWTFSFGNHTWHFVLLSPVVAMTTFSAGELAILKATRRLRDVAASSACVAVSTLVVSVPVYYFMGNRGIVPSLLLALAAQTLFVASRSMRAYPFRLHFDVGLLREGRGVLRLGVAFVLAGMATSGAEMCIRAYLNYVGGTDVVGLYNAAYVMIFTYAGMVFTAMDADYYPRLSSVESLGIGFNGVVNSQMEVSLHLVSPMLVVFIMAMPLLLPLLYSGKFVSVVPMIQVAALSMYARAMYVPVEYIPLARGDSRVFMLMEALNATLLVGMVVAGYSRYGLIGAGIGLTVASFVEIGVSMLICRLRYGYRPSAQIVMASAVHIGIGAMAYAATFIHVMSAYCAVGVVVFAVDTAFSLCVVMRKRKE